MIVNKRAFSLVEILVVLLIAVSVVGAVYFSFYSSSRSVDRLELTILLQEESRAMMEIMARDLRLAGSFPNGIDPMSCALTCEGIVSADSSSIQIARDLNGDGCCDDADEIVTYRYVADDQKICRKSSLDDSCESFIGGLEEDDVGVKVTNFLFQFYDSEGNLLDLSDPANIDNIVRVRIETTLSSNKEAISGSFPQLSLSFDINIRNRVLGL